MYPALGESTRWQDGLDPYVRRPRRRPKPVTLTLPGQGIPKPGCGAPVPLYCNEHDGAFWVSSHCGSRECPECYGKWARGQGASAARRVAWGTKTLQVEHPGQRPRVVHCVVSVPQPDREVNDRSLDDARARVYSTAKAHGLEGGIAIFHATRKGDDPADGYVPDGYWHYHLIAASFGDISPGGTGGDAVFVHLRDPEYGDYRGLRSELAISRLVSYLLSHASLEGKSSHAVRYWGALSYNRLSQARVDALYRFALDEHGKTNPARSARCPVDGSSRTEPCNPNTWRVTYDSPPGHAQPEDDPTPEAVANARTALEEDFEFRYQTASDREERYRLGKERWHGRSRLAMRETELFNMNNSLVVMWHYVEGQLALHGQGISDMALFDSVHERDHPILEAVVNANLRTGRLRRSPRGIIALGREYTLSCAQADMSGLIRSGSARGRDEGLDELLRRHPPRDNLIMTDTGFVFGTLLSDRSEGSPCQVCIGAMRSEV